MTTPSAPSRPRVLSGFRPTGPLHLGHLLGALENWVRLQDTHDCFFFVADWHALTTEYANPAASREHVDEMVLDWLAAGLDPRARAIFVQSHVPEHAELHLLLSHDHAAAVAGAQPDLQGAARAARATATCRPTASSATRCSRRPTS